MKRTSDTKDIHSIILEFLTAVFKSFRTPHWFNIDPFISLTDGLFQYISKAIINHMFSSSCLDHRGKQNYAFVVKAVLLSMNFTFLVKYSSYQRRNHILYLGTKMEFCF